jgi:hypothetical protein
MTAVLSLSIVISGQEVLQKVNFKQLQIERIATQRAF